MINIIQAKEAFSEYVKMYNLDDTKIALKIKHIYMVADNSRKIAIRVGFNEEEQQLAELIGLLHDIGRFEQIRLYNTFVDSKSVNHGELGVKILFEDGLIRKFVSEDYYDDIIKVAILNHNKGKIDPNISGKTLEFCKVIRDADKLDIFRVFLSESLEDTHEKADLSEDLVSDEIFREFKYDRYIDYKNRESSADIMVSHIAYIYDFNYDYCLKQIRNGRYIEKLIDLANFKNEETIKKMNEIVEIANDYMDEKLSKAEINS